MVLLEEFGGSGMGFVGCKVMGGIIDGCKNYGGIVDGV